MAYLCITLPCSHRRCCTSTRTAQRIQPQFLKVETDYICIVALEISLRVSSGSPALSAKPPSRRAGSEDMREELEIRGD